MFSICNVLHAILTSPLIVILSKVIIVPAKKTLPLISLCTVIVLPAAKTSLKISASFSILITLPAVNKSFSTVPFIVTFSPATKP